MGETPTPASPHRYIDTHGKHAWIYQVDGRWSVEHCGRGRWMACPLEAATRAEAVKETYRHLRRQAHGSTQATRVGRPYHAEGGARNG